MTSDSKPTAHGSLVDPTDPSKDSSNSSDSSEDSFVGFFYPPKAKEATDSAIRFLISLDEQTEVAAPDINENLSAISPEMRSLISSRDLPAARRNKIISMALRSIYPALTAEVDAETARNKMKPKTKDNKHG